MGSLSTILFRTVCSYPSKEGIEVGSLVRDMADNASQCVEKHVPSHLAMNSFIQDTVIITLLLFRAREGAFVRKEDQSQFKHNLHSRNCPISIAYISHLPIV